MRKIWGMMLDPEFDPRAIADTRPIKLKKSMEGLGALGIPHSPLPIRIGPHLPFAVQLYWHVRLKAPKLKWRAASLRSANRGASLFFGPRDRNEVC